MCDGSIGPPLTLMACVATNIQPIDAPTSPPESAARPWSHQPPCAPIHPPPSMRLPAALASASLAVLNNWSRDCSNTRQTRDRLAAFRVTQSDFHRT
jgi:hypothetical protein